MTTDVEVVSPPGIDLAAAKAHEIRRWAMTLREQVPSITDTDRLMELSALLAGARHRLKQLKGEVVEAERTRVAVVLQLGRLLPPPSQDPTSADRVAGVPRELRRVARAFAAYPDIVESALEQPNVTVSRIDLRIRDAKAADSLAEENARVVEAQRAFQVLPGQTWAMGEHRLYCGRFNDQGFRALLGHHQPRMAYVDLSMIHVAEVHWLTEYVDLLALMPYVHDLGTVYATVLEPHVWTLAYVHNRPTPGPVGGMSWWPVAVFGSRAKLTLDEDYHFIRDDMSHLRDSRKPLSLMMRVLEHLSAKDDCVVDVTPGLHGLTLFAADKLGRRALLAENDPMNCASILARYGKEAHILKV